MQALRRFLAKYSRADKRAVILLTVIPVLVFTIPALFHYPAVTDDNLIQNYPLRAFTGELLRSGHWPLWNPYAWSGSVLLASMNAGSFHPPSLLFAVLPGVSAWVLNLCIAYWCAGLGFFALARWSKISSRAALLGAATYCFGGAMVGQLSHVQVIQAMGYIPIGLLAILGIARHSLGESAGKSSRSAAGYALLLAAIVGLIALVGEPRGIAEAEIVFSVAVLYALLRKLDRVASPGLRPRLAFLLWTAGAGALGVGLGAVQLIPGLGFIHSSQRAHLSYWFFGSGSLPLRWSSLLLMPNIFGGNGIAHEPHYFMGYSLPEVTGYIGLLALVGIVAGLMRVFRDPEASSRTRSPLYLILALLGLTMAWGSFSPLGHLFHAIPFFGRTRLPSRNIAIFDFAGAMLLALVIEDFAQRDLVGWLRDKWRAILLFGPVAMLLMAIPLLFTPVGFEIFMGAKSQGDAGLAHFLAPWVIFQIALALGAVLLISRAPRLTASKRLQIATFLVSVDLLAFVLSSGMGFSSGKVTLEPSQAQAQQVLGSRGRFAVVNSAQSNLPALADLGPTNQNVFTKIGSVEGYGSLTDQVYADATGTHGRNSLDPCAVASGRMKQLQLTTVVAWASAFAPYKPPGQGAQDQAQLSSCQHNVLVPGLKQRKLWFGHLATISSISLRALAGGQGRQEDLKIVFLGGKGQLLAQSKDVAKPTQAGWQLNLTRPLSAAGIAISGAGAGSVSLRSSFMDAKAMEFSLAGSFQTAFDAKDWFPGGATKDYQIFRNHFMVPDFSMSQGSIISSKNSNWGTSKLLVQSPKGARLTRAVAYSGGWLLHGVGPGGREINLPVERHGLVQAVTIPPGRWSLSFSYKPRSFTLGLFASLFSLLFLLVASLWLWRNKELPARFGRVRK